MMMQFKAVEPKLHNVLFFVISLVGYMINKSVLLLIFAIVFILLTNIKYIFDVGDHQMSFTTYLFGLKVMRRTVTADNVKFIAVKREGFYRKVVLIRLNKGFRWKITRFFPDNFDEYVQNFAVANAIKFKNFS
ncbi:hypothetical protein ACFSTH_01060 [Paenibacillus yanchengensis]|uniref:Uncharacterized protein n=1 Tax=Paenibacillus yanchengensis TaxID=2035833 RepID=A0ABW4YF60_9BACL